MEEIKDENTLRFVKYWEQRFNRILEQNTNWTKLFLTLEQNSLPSNLNIDKFCSKYGQDFQLTINYKLDENSNNFDLTITR